MAVTPSGGAPTVLSFTIDNNAPAMAPRLPSQCSGFGSNLKIERIKFAIIRIQAPIIYFSSMSNALADVQNSPVRYDSLAMSCSRAYDSVLLSRET